MGKRITKSSAKSTEIKPDFSFEKKFWKKGFEFIAGIDEVGRGCFAGPMVAASVVFSSRKLKEFEGIKIDDSKKLTAKAREKADKWIRENSLSWGIGEVSASTINRVGMAKASKIVFRRAIKDASVKFKGKINFLLIDAFYVPYVRGIRRKNQLAIIDGDAKSISIAAASIVAKVYRDSLMTKIGFRKRYKKYAWIQNKGYGTKVHREAIAKYGITGYHRREFVRNYIK